MGKIDSFLTTTDLYNDTEKRWTQTPDIPKLGKDQGSERTHRIAYCSEIIPRHHGPNFGPENKRVKSKRKRENKTAAKEVKTQQVTTEEDSPEYWSLTVLVLWRSRRKWIAGIRNTWLKSKYMFGRWSMISLTTGADNVLFSNESKPMASRYSSSRC